jgi:peptide/nickel transport system substrate-binding protein
MFSAFQRANENNFNVYDMFLQYAAKDTGQGYMQADVTQVVGRSMESYEFAPDKLSVKLTLRKDVKFGHTGREMTTDDVMYFFERAFANDKAGSKFNLKVLNIPDLDHVKVTGPNEITIRFDKPSPYFLYLFRDQAMAPIDSVEVKKNATDDDPWATKWMAKHDAGAGPYFIESWTPGVEIVYRRNPYYWDKPPYFDKVVLKVVPNSADRAMLLKAGTVDIATELTAEELNALQGAPGVKILSVPTRNQLSLGMNYHIEPFTKKAVRQALSYAVPYDDIIAGVFKGQALKSEGGPLAVLSQYNTKGLWPYTYDLEKAKKLLADAGYPNGLQFTLDIPTGLPIAESVAVVLKDSFAKIGVDMTINKQSDAAFAEQLWNGKHPSYMRDILWYVDDVGYISAWGYMTGGICNWTTFSDSRIDDLTKQLETTTDAAKRAELGKQWQKIMIDEAPLLFLADMNFQLAMRDNIDGYLQLPENYLYYYTLYRK